MKVKNRRSASKAEMCPEERSSDFTEQQRGGETTSTGSGRRKKNGDNSRSCKTEYKTPQQTAVISNGNADAKLNKRKRINGTSSCVLSSGSFRNNSSAQSNSCSSASSIVSSSGEVVDPYEFAVKTEDQNECALTNAVPPMKRMKLGRVGFVVNFPSAIIRIRSYHFVHFILVYLIFIFPLPA